MKLDKAIAGYWAEYLLESRHPTAIAAHYEISESGRWKMRRNTSGLGTKLYSAWFGTELGGKWVVDDHGTLILKVRQIDGDVVSGTLGKVLLGTPFRGIQKAAMLIRSSTNYTSFPKYYPLTLNHDQINWKREEWDDVMHSVVTEKVVWKRTRTPSAW